MTESSSSRQRAKFTKIKVNSPEHLEKVLEYQSDEKGGGTIGGFFLRMKELGVPEAVLVKTMRSDQRRMAEFAQSVQIDEYIEIDKTHSIHPLQLFFREVLTELNQEELLDILDKENFDYSQDQEMEDMVEEQLHRHPDFDREGVDQDTLRQRVRAHAIIDEVSDILLTRFYDYDESGKSPVGIDFFELCAEKNRRDVEDKQEALLNRIEGEYKPRLIDDVRTHIESGYLPEHVLERFSHVLDTVRFQVVDLFYSELERDLRVGSFEQRARTLKFSLRIPKDREYGVFAHEMLHALSGEILGIEDMDEDIPERYRKNHVHSLSLGLRFGSTRNSNSLQRLVWLNEAMTERITVRFLGKETPHYTDFRNLLGFLIEHGVPEDLFVSAYFEDFDPDSDAHRLPHMRELFKKTNTVFCEGFLIKLDKLVTQKGIKEVNSMVEEQGFDFVCG